MAKKAEKNENKYARLTLDQLTERMEKAQTEFEELEAAAKAKAESGIIEQIKDALQSAEVLSSQGHKFTKNGEATKALKRLVKEIYGSDYKIEKKGVSEAAGVSSDDNIKDCEIVLNWLSEQNAFDEDSAITRKDIEAGIGQKLRGHYWINKRPQSIKMNNRKYYVENN